MNPLHASEMRCYQRCPREWQHSYQSQREPLVKPEALSRGTAVHRYLNRWWMCEVDDPIDPIVKACCWGYSARYGAPHLSSVRVELPFTCTLGGVDCAGTVDAHGYLGDVEYVVEHKTTSSDISAGSAYWREVMHTNLQASLYLAAFPNARILYDVLRKPAFSKLRKGKPSEETDDELVARCLAAMAEEPAKYFARYEVVRLEVEKTELAADIVMVDRLRRGVEHPRNPSSCFTFGRECGYFPVCWEGRSLSNDTLYKDSER